MSQHRPCGGDSLVLLAHGSADVRHRRGLEVLTAAVGRRVDLPVRVAYLDHHGPNPGQVASHLVTTGHLHAWVLPVFTSQGYHLRVDVPLAMSRMTDFGLQVDEVDPGLAGNPALVRAALSALSDPRLSDPRLSDPRLSDPRLSDPRLSDPRSVGPGLGNSGLGNSGLGRPVPIQARPVVLFAAGSTDRAACCELARQVVGAARGPVAAAFLTGGPGLGQAIDSLLPTAGPTSGHRPAVLPFVIAAGILRDRMAREAASLGLELESGSLSENPVVADLMAELVRSTAEAALIPVADHFATEAVNSTDTSSATLS